MEPKIGHVHAVTILGLQVRFTDLGFVADTGNSIAPSVDMSAYESKPQYVYLTIMARH